MAMTIQAEGSFSLSDGRAVIEPGTSRVVPGTFFSAGMHPGTYFKDIEIKYRINKI
jgi:hypothetical protein